MLHGVVTLTIMSNYAQLTEDELAALVQENAEKVIEQEEIISRDTLTEIRNGKFFDEQHLLSVELLVSDDYIYDWEQIRHSAEHDYTDPIKIVELKGLQKLYGLTWERVTDMVEYEHQ